jgi:Raf kinase inhibitor-like YbhB/YbcL family protein
MRYVILTLGVLLIAGAVVWYQRAQTSPKNPNTVLSSIAMGTEGDFRITSPAFTTKGTIPQRFTCDGDGQSPIIKISGVPAAAKSLVLIVDDPDVPKQIKSDGLFTHWVLFNIPPDTAEIPEGGTVGIPGNNSTGAPGYTPPCPPGQFSPREHRYIFNLFALDTVLDLNAGTTREALLQAMDNHLLSHASLTGVYARP